MAQGKKKIAREKVKANVANVNIWGIRAKDMKFFVLLMQLTLKIR